MDTCIASPLEARTLLAQVQSDANVLSSKLAVLVQQYDHDCSSCRSLRQENHLLRQHLEQLKEIHAGLAIEQLSFSAGHLLQDRLSAAAPPRCLQDDAQHFAPTPVEARGSLDVAAAKEPTFVTVRVDGPDEGRTLKVHARDCKRLRDMSKAPSPKEHWNAEAFDSGEDFRSRMPRRLRQSQIDRLAAQHIMWSPVLTSPEKSPDARNSKRDRSFIQNSIEGEVEGVRHLAFPDGEVFATSVTMSTQERRSSSSQGRRVSEARSSALQVISSNVSTAEPISSALEVNEIRSPAASRTASIENPYALIESPRPLDPASQEDNVSAAGGSSRRDSKASAEQVICRSCGNTGIDFMGNPCLCPYSERARHEARARDEVQSAKPEATELEAEPAPREAAPNNVKVDQEYIQKLVAEHHQMRKAGFLSMQLGNKLRSLGVQVNEQENYWIGPDGMRGMLEVPAAPLHTSSEAVPNRLPTHEVVELARSADHHSRNGENGGGFSPTSSDHGPRSARALLLQSPPPSGANADQTPAPTSIPDALGTSPGSARRLLSGRRSSRTTPRSSQRGGSPSPPPMERRPEPVKAVQTTPRGGSGVQEPPVSREASAAPGDSGVQDIPISRAASLSVTRALSVKTNAEARRRAHLSMNSEESVLPPEEPIGTPVAKVRTWSSSPGVAMPLTMTDGDVRRSQSTASPTASATLGDQTAPTLERKKNASVLELLEDDPLKRWPIWRFSNLNQFKRAMTSEHMQIRGTINRRFMKLAASPKGWNRHSTGTPGAGEHEGANWEQSISCMMTHPRHPKMTLWHFLGTSLILYDVLMIPVDCFELPENAVTLSMTWASVSYWSSDFILQFFLGYENELGQVEVRPRAVATHYLRSWFIMDAVIVTFDWLNLFVFGIGGSSRSSRVGRAIRALRFVRTLRIVKLLSLVGRILDRVMTEYVRILAKVSGIFVFALVAAHYLGCFWYWVGKQNYGDFPVTWLTEVEKDEDFYFWRLYTISLHWSFAQSGFTPTDILPLTTSERAYTLFAGCMWMSIVAATVSKLTLWLIQLKDSQKDRVAQETQIRKYLRLNGVSTDLCEEVVRACRKFSLIRAKRVHTTDIVAFEDLPLELRVSVHRQVFMPILVAHPLFEDFLKVNEAACAATCHLAMGEHYYPAGTEVFTHGQEAKLTFFVLSGELEYFSEKRDWQPTEVGVGEWICEPVLWRYWVCQGRLIAKSSSELVSIDACKFHDIIDEGEDKGWSVNLLRYYAEAATQHFDDVDPNTDIWSQGEGVLTDLVNRSTQKAMLSDKRFKAGISTSSLDGMKKSLKQRMFDR